MIKNDEEVQKLFHDILSAHSSFGAGINMMKQIIIDQDEEDDTTKLMPLIEKKINELNDIFKKLQAKIHK
jgi:hypothetical protein